MKAIYALIFLVGCSTQNIERKVASEEEIKFDLQLIHNLSVKPVSEDGHPTELPYTVRYNKNGKEIIYLSTMHTSDVNSKTHKAIDQVLKSFRPKSVIVEIPGFNEDRRHEILGQCDRVKKCVEGPYAYLQALDMSIEAISGEPSDKKVFEASLKEGMTEDEFIFFYVFRTIATWRSNEADRAYHPENPDLEILKYIKSVKRLLNLTSSTFDLKGFKEIYQTKMGKEFDYKKTGYEDIAPYYDGHAIQRMSVIIDKSREESILKILEDKINKSDKVFIIYGSGHFLKHRPVLIDVFKNETVLAL